MNNSYTIKDLIQLFLSKIWLIIVVTVVGAAVGFGVSKLCIAKKYSSYITLYVQCYTDIKDDNNQSDISKSKQLIGTYIELLGQDDYVMNQISDDLVKKFDETTLKYCFSMNENGIKPSALRESLSLTSVTDTSAIKAVATTKNAEVSSAILQSLKEHANDDEATSIGVGAITSPIENVPVFTSAVSPNLLKNSLLGAAAGFMLIILIVLMIDFFDDTIKGTSDLENKYKASILGQVEKVVLFDKNGKKIKEKKKIKPIEALKRKLKIKGDKASVIEDKHYKLTDDNVPFYFKESFKSIRTNVTFSLAASDRRNIFAVTSANPSEGKSTISSNLAIAFAESGKKVLLIDADMRRHVQDRIFKIAGSVGLSTAIVDVAENPEILETIKPYEPNTNEKHNAANETTEKNKIDLPAENSEYDISERSSETNPNVQNNVNNDGSGSATTGDPKKGDKATTGIGNAAPNKNGQSDVSNENSESAPPVENIKHDASDKNNQSGADVENREQNIDSNSDTSGDSTKDKESNVAEESQEKTATTDNNKESKSGFMTRYIQEISLKTKTKVENDEGKQVDEETEVKLHVMPAGKVPPNPSELLASEQMKKMLDKLSTVYDTIIVDTAPINSVSDSMQFADRISGIVLVARCNQTTEDSMDAAMKQVELSKMHILGFVLNDVNTRYHKKYYKKYYRGGGITISIAINSIMRKR